MDASEYSHLRFAAIRCKHFPAGTTNQADFINISILKRSQLADSLQAQNLLLVNNGDMDLIQLY